MRRLAFFLALIPLVGACCRQGGFTSAEREIIRRSDSVMYLTVLFDSADSAVLRSPSRDLPLSEIRGEDFRTLGAKMLATVQSPKQDGVGIAAPQVGINARVIAVWRSDKEGKPFELYANAHLDSLWGEVTHGPEGCLSYPPYRGLVPRYSSVLVSYVDPQTLEHRQDTVHGYSAIIFQHECDHLDGHLYIDRADTVFHNPSWAAEREAFDYSKPEWMKALKR